MFDKVDIDKSGIIDYSEFLVAAMSQQRLLSRKKLQQAFKMFDKDGGGSISIEEIKDALNFEGGLSAADLVQISKEVDQNGDGEVSFNEFVEMMQDHL